PDRLGPLRLSPPTIPERETEASHRPLRGNEGRAAEEAKASSMAAVVRSVWQGIREKGLTNFLRYAREEGYLKCLGDGNLL
uniref:Uncharacterized protein n=1 Tax=Aegilops tauschii subsp. strangulata TaxID=200361 RepID=A0A452YRE8_AEGTS